MNLMQINPIFIRNAMYSIEVMGTKASYRYTVMKCNKVILYTWLGNNTNWNLIHTIVLQLGPDTAHADGIKHSPVLKMKQ